MTIHATLYGRAVFEPRQLTTKTGKPMTTCRLAVDATGHNAEEQQTLWVDVLAFGRNAELLAGVAKGRMISAMGRVTKSVYTTKDGIERDHLSLLADSIITAGSGRPNPKPYPRTEDKPADYGPSSRMQDPDDQLPF